MSDQRVTVWVQKFNDRPHLVLQWIEAGTCRRKSKSAKTEDPDVAEQKRADLEYELNHGTYQEDSKVSWDSFRELFETEYAAGLRKNNRRNYAATMDAFEDICKPSRVSAVDERMVSKFAAGLRKRPGRKKGTQEMMPSTIQVRLQFFHTVLTWAVDQKLIGKVPKFPRVKVPKKDPQPVPLEMFERLLAKAEDAQMRAYLLCGWLAGLRLSEALALERETTDKAPHLDLARSRIVLPAEFVKADRDQWVPLDAELRDAIEALPRHGRKVFRFTSSKGELLDVSGVSQRVVALAKRAGVRISMKALRRGFGCRYAGKVPAQVLQKLMRHANIKTTMDYYANVDEAVEAAILGLQRNVQRNIGSGAPSNVEQEIAITTSQGGLSCPAAN